ncbi:MAG: hypothetical protein US83_C0017G0014 [Candidatus Falkowbacteria bacterium GW2011_GWC2_38_22]|uniref:Uncharacterized protein n=1 Tax=Candidatus Falkowbacteria bacterium GW2011_GWE1_38_31 TaxID=1618638 RepID=A0A0G0MX89_9BACT|nr:MAG: hypothetical protein US73_C0015G0014 [Candidatus Falkowbacteria bacterium GW2011_GWF2_38_1205]KKQ60492.1 MAG: hypothetical protein US83_C0017G0014 [Candidatus Falkowbacteria bacterium GW2011_GWC2_38_22]KKQ62590.1 MAG: hypothetical protein US84_C0014G0014 [Candidatus Falkowbacteria bacterium GW2011_GWF1_38_22]KKQ64637.1 MAG: hypothetical protein US87_C0014G0014 [Candidatus Falkowbacteria bacterium GW2011_GWE2_38_254]KKQ69546.1 MAG: hypothetical protein US91_C0013G0014 [Candidatus Falkowb
MIDTSNVAGKTQQYHNLICKRERLQNKLKQPENKVVEVVTRKKLADIQREIEKIRIELS